MPHRHKLSVAREQIEEGIRHLVSGRFIASLTLLAAAEEILARFVEDDTGAHPLDEDWKSWEEIRMNFKVKSISKRDHFKIVYAARNAVKHHDKGKSRYFEHDSFGAAFSTVQRVVHYAQQAGLKFKYKSLYARWFKLNFSPENNGKGLHFFSREAVR